MRLVNKSVQSLVPEGTKDSLMTAARPVEQMISLLNLIDLGVLIIVLIFCFLFSKFRKIGNLLEGVLFGGLFGIMMSADYLFTYVLFPLELKVLIAETITNITIYISGGITMALIYKPQEE